MLEIGKIYIVKVNSGNVWLFKKYRGVFHADKLTSCSQALCLEDMYKGIEGGYVCRDNQIVYLKEANENYLAIWNRTFNENIEMV